MGWKTREITCGHTESIHYAHGMCKLCYQRSRYPTPKFKEKNRLSAKEHVRNKRKKISELKSGPCMDCGIIYPTYVMDWDHRPEEEKLFTIGHSSLYSLPRVLAEIEKCDLVCANCHRERSHQRRVQHAN